MPDSVKKILNNANLIAHLAPLLKGPQAAALAKAAQVYRSILHDFHVEVDTRDFKGCDQAELLVAWITGEQGPPDVELMTKWTAEIWAAIADLAAGKLPG